MRYDDDRIQRLELHVEQLTDRVARLEGRAPAAAASPPRVAAARPPAPPERTISPPRLPSRPTVDLEELLGGRVLAWAGALAVDRKSTRLNSSHANISYAVFC